MSARTTQNTRPSVWFDEKMKRRLIKSGITGATLAAASGIMYGMGNVTVAGVNVPTVIPMFVAGAGSSFGADYIHDLYYPHLGSTAQKLGDIGATALGAGVAGAASTAIAALGVGMDTANYLPMFALGAGSYVAADYLEMKLLEKDGHLIF